MCGWRGVSKVHVYLEWYLCLSTPASHGVLGKLLPHSNKQAYFLKKPLHVRHCSVHGNDHRLK